MNKNFLLILFIVSSTLFSQSEGKLKKYAIRDAELLSKASLNEDFNTILKFTHPKIYDKLGKKQLLTVMEDMYKTMAAQKIKITSSEIEKVTEIKKENKEYRCLVRNIIKMNFNGRKVTLKSSLFGFYNNKEDFWYFVESNKLLNDPDTKELFPDFKTEIVIPEDEQISDDN